MVFYSPSKINLLNCYNDRRHTDTHGSPRVSGAKSVPRMVINIPTLTDAAIRTAKANTTVRDSSLEGFGVRAGKTRKTFIVLIGSGRRVPVPVPSADGWYCTLTF